MADPAASVDANNRPAIKAFMDVPRVRADFVLRLTIGVNASIWLEWVEARA
jgi:hypothetical protein